MEFSIGMDWLTLAGKVNKNDGDKVPVGYGGIVEFALELSRAFEGRLSTLKSTHAAKFYHAGFTSKESGVSYHFNNNLASQGWLIVVTGRACRNVPPVGDIQKFMDVYKAHVTRFDFAVDMFDCGITPVQEFEAFVEEHGYESEFKSGLDTSEADGGYTRGSRESERYWRFYDKAKEQGLNLDWCRSEMEYKGGLAHWAFDGFSEDPIQMIGDTIRYARTPNSPLVKMLQQISLGSVIKKLKRAPAYHDKEKWLSGQVLTSFIKLAEEDPKAALRVFDLFCDECASKGVFAQSKIGLDTE